MEIETLRPWEQDGIPAGVQRLDYRSQADRALDWALIWPPAQGDRWIVVIHGHGSQGDQLYTREDVRDLWLPVFRRLGYGLLTPHLRGNAWMGPRAASDLQDLHQYMRLEFRARRFIFASGSMGGTSNLVYAVLHPDDVAAVIALCPATDLALYRRWCRERNEGVIREIADAIEAAYAGTPDQVPRNYQAHSAVQNATRLIMPVYVVHGTRDAVIPVSQSRRLAAAVGDKSDFAGVEVPDGHHDSPLVCMPTALAWVEQQILL